MYLLSLCKRERDRKRGRRGEKGEGEVRRRREGEERRRGEKDRGEGRGRREKERGEEGGKGEGREERERRKGRRGRNLNFRVRNGGNTHGHRPTQPQWYQSLQ
jgi:hypothetical protein